VYVSRKRDGAATKLSEQATINDYADFAPIRCCRVAEFSSHAANVRTAACDPDALTLFARKTTERPQQWTDVQRTIWWPPIE